MSGEGCRFVSLYWKGGGKSVLPKLQTVIEPAEGRGKTEKCSGKQERKAFTLTENLRQSGKTGRHQSADHFAKRSRTQKGPDVWIDKKRGGEDR